ncbi:hypothetical protein [Streptomyces canus]|uniref:hypothetical protein n=1 Tax=Streptomyces canus TaxID=58343 RepID=UPI002E282434|nr:hypothetical protein [Streptomyces canus]
MTEPEFDLRDLHPKASPEVVAERQALAERVCRELRHAGLPVHRADLSGGPRRDPALDLFARGIDSWSR